MDFAFLYRDVGILFSKALNFSFVFLGHSFKLYICIIFICAIGLVWYLISNFFGIGMIPDPFSGIKGD